MRIFILKTMKKINSCDQFNINIYLYKERNLCFTIKTIKKNNKNIREMADIVYVNRRKKRGKASVKARLLICSVLFSKRMSFKFIFSRMANYKITSRALKATHLSQSFVRK